MIRYNTFCHQITPLTSFFNFWRCNNFHWELFGSFFEKISYAFCKRLLAKYEIFPYLIVMELHIGFRSLEVSLRLCFGQAFFGKLTFL